MAGAFENPIFAGAGMALKSKDGCDFMYQNDLGVKIPSGSFVYIPTPDTTALQGFLAIAPHSILDGDIGTVTVKGQWDVADYQGGQSDLREFAVGEYVYYDMNEVLAGTPTIHLYNAHDVAGGTTQDYRVLGICTQATGANPYIAGQPAGTYSAVTRVLLTPFTAVPDAQSGTGGTFTAEGIRAKLAEIAADSAVTDIASLKSALATAFARPTSDEEVKEKE